jgi:MFS family permease
MFSHLYNFLRLGHVRAIGLIFLLQGALFGTWSAFIPLLKIKFGLDDGQLGLLLLSLPAGVLLMNPVAVPVLKRLGAARSSLIFLAAAGLLFILPVLAPSIPFLVVSLFLAGSAFTFVNIAMNTSASLIEANEPVRIMATCHGLWSLGAMLGSALAGMATGWGMSPLLYSSLLAALVTTAALMLQRGEMHRVAAYSLALRHEENTTEAAGFSMPNAALWAIIALSICTNLTEGAMADWAGVYMREIVVAPAYMTGWGFAAYALFMALGRFTGDAVLARYDAFRVLRVGGAVVALGFVLAILLPYTATAMLGFALVGAGVSLGAPILYAAAARVPGMAQGAGLATMNTFAMIGFLGGPALIGFVAKAYSLPTAFSLVLVAALFWVWRAR